IQSAAVPVNVWHHFINNVLVELLMTDSFILRVHLVIQPALAIDAVNGIHPDLPAVDKGAELFYQVKSFILQEISRRCRQHQKRETIIAVRDCFHFLIEVWAMPLGYFSSHLILYMIYIMKPDFTDLTNFTNFLLRLLRHRLQE